MAYAKLLLVSEELNYILRHGRSDYDGGYCSDPDENCNFIRKKQRIQPLHDNIVSLLTFLEDFPREAGQLQAPITNAANPATRLSFYHSRNENDDEWKMFSEVLEKSIEETDSILKEVMQIRSGSRSENLMSSHSAGSSSSRLAPNGKDTVVGFDEDLIEIKSRLCGEPSNLRIIPVIGMGGIGKTTLARYAYHDPSTFHHFDIRVWVTVSQNSRIRRILLRLLSSIDPFNKQRYQGMDEELLIQHGYKYLRKRRYLIVMDDMWDTSVWDDVRRTFPDDCNGSRIIITTRELDVASYVDSSSHPHEMHLMAADQSWKLLKEKVFAQENCPPELKEIGKQIAENCRGLPLAIVVIAGVLSKVNQMQDAWTNIARNVIEAVNRGDGHFSEILSLSYAHLSDDLRPCFLYMGSFPEDYEINVSKLIKLWVAEGFVRSNRSKDLEEVAEEYLEDLTKRSLILVTKKRYNSKIKAVKIHDLLRDLCLRKARDEKFLHAIDEFSGSFPEGIENSSRLSITCHISGGFPDMDGSPIRTILLFHHWAFDSWKSFRRLRVVDALTVTFMFYPEEIGELFDLRYLAFTSEPPKKFPAFEVSESLFKLQNLQTLIIIDSSKWSTSYLPFRIWRMPQLRHLVLVDGSFPDPCTETCGQILALENLHTLKRVCGFTCSERILGMIPNLKKLGITYSFRDIYKTGWSQFGLNNLVHLHKLEKLNFNAHSYDNELSNLSQNIAFPLTLKKLTLSGSRIPWEDMSIVGSLPNLEVLKLKRHACQGIEWETTEGEFCELKQLLIDSTDPHHWTTESSHFPRLERLLLHNCHSLKEIPYSVGEIPTLRLIVVDVCNLSIVESAKSIQEEQRSFGNDLQVHLESSSNWNEDMALLLNRHGIDDKHYLKYRV